MGGNTKIYPAFGITPARRVARFNEGIQLMRALWTEPRVTFAGEFWQLEDAAMEPKPVQRPHPPLWLGAHHPDALRRAVRWDMGFMGAGSASTATFAREMGMLRGFLGEAGRDPASIDVGKRVYVAVDRDRERAGRRLAEYFGAFYGRAELAAEVSVWGSADQVRRRAPRGRRRRRAAPHAEPRVRRAGAAGSAGRRRDSRILAGSYRARPGARGQRITRAAGVPTSM